MSVKALRRQIENVGGFGLVPLLLIVFGVGIAVAGMYTSVLTVMRSQISVSVSQDADLIVDQINQVLTNDSVCTAALTGNVLDVTPREVSATLRLSDSDVMVAQGLKISPQLRVEHFTLERKLLPDNVTLIQDAAFVINPDAVLASQITKTRRVGKIKIQLRKNEGTFAPLSRPHEITVHSIVDPVTNVMSACTAESSEVVSCTAAGGVWNAEAVPPARKCEPYVQCEYAGAYSMPSGIGARGSLQPNPGAFPNQAFPDAFGNPQYGCPSGFAPQQSGTITKVRSCGKSNPCNDFFPVYSCVRCGKGLSTFTADTGLDLDFASGGNAATAYGGILGSIQNIINIRYQRYLCAVYNIGC